MLSYFKKYSKKLLEIANDLFFNEGISLSNKEKIDDQEKNPGSPLEQDPNDFSDTTQSSKLTLEDVSLRARLIKITKLIKYSKDKQAISDYIKEVKSFAESHSTNFQDFKILLTSIENEKTSQANLSSCAFVDENKKKVIISINGTNSKEDLIDDFQIATGLELRKTSVLNKFIDEVIKKLPNGAQDYSFEVTGHSLGAVLSDYAASRLHNLGFNVERSTTFENPGSYTVVNRYFDASEVKNAIKFDVYNTNPNVINLCDYNMSDNITLVQPKNVKKVGIIKGILYKLMPNLARLNDFHDLFHFEDIHEEDQFSTYNVMDYKKILDFFKERYSLDGIDIYDPLKGFLLGDSISITLGKQENMEDIEIIKSIFGFGKEVLKSASDTYDAIKDSLDYASLIGKESSLFDLSEDLTA